ncbi:MAG: hypothetical protein LBT56_04665 [Prevotellaceae bacterium]|jgi:hypothetical protein|nr:hypothetical protein [Prevotellaceae bacterium]
MSKSTVDIIFAIAVMAVCFKWLHRKFGKLKISPEKKERMENEIEKMKSEHPAICKFVDILLIFICLSLFALLFFVLLN